MDVDAPDASDDPRPAPPPTGGFRDVLAPLASLKLTVVLFALSVFIVFAGTLAQRFYGIWTVVDEIFRCYLTWIELRFFVPASFDISPDVKFPFPGGFLIGALLLINITSAHAIRFKVRAKGGKRLAGLGVLLVGFVLTGMMIKGMFANDLVATEGGSHVDAFWPVFWRLMRGGAAAVVLWVGCLLLFEKRAGIVLLHGGIILMLVSEVVTGYWAVEGQMRIPEGETMNYITHNRVAELAITDRSDEDQDHVVVIPRGLLRGEGLIQHASLPFDMRVEKYMINSDLFQGEANTENLATAGNGLRIVAREIPEGSGVDSEQRIDLPAVYVTLLKKGTDESLGTYLGATLLSLQEKPIVDNITVDDKEYDMSLRFKRTYKPYTVHLIDFKHDRYVGTQKAKNFSSLVQLQDPGRGVDRKINIWMNNPMRYRGETFYQSSFEPGDQVTILQVVKNVGWMMPYLSCMIVGMGLTAHFGQTLLTFLKKRRAGL
jgi:hypothetical protein